MDRNHVHWLSPVLGCGQPINGLLEKALGRLHISLLAEHRINQIAISIDGPIEVAPFPLDVDIAFIHIPGPRFLLTSFGTQLIGDEWGKARFPVSNGLMGELKASFQIEFSLVAQTQLLPQPPEDNEKNNIGGIFQIVERRPCTLVKRSLAV